MIEIWINFSVPYEQLHEELWKLASAVFSSFLSFYNVGQWKTFGQRIISVKNDWNEPTEDLLQNIKTFLLVFQNVYGQPRRIPAPLRRSPEMV